MQTTIEFAGNFTVNSIIRLNLKTLSSFFLADFEQAFYKSFLVENICMTFL